MKMGDPDAGIAPNPFVIRKLAGSFHAEAILVQRVYLLLEQPPDLRSSIAQFEELGDIPDAAFGVFVALLHPVENVGLVEADHVAERGSAADRAARADFNDLRITEFVPAPLAAVGQVADDDPVATLRRNQWRHREWMPS